MRLLPRSLQGRLLALVLVGVSAVWLAAAVLTWRDARHELDELLDGHLTQAAALLVAQQVHEIGDAPAHDDGEARRGRGRGRDRGRGGEDGRDASGHHDDDHGVDAPSFHRYAPRVAFQVFHEGQLVMRSADAPDAPMLPLGMPADGALQTVAIAGTDWRVFAAEGAEHDVRVLVGEQVTSRQAILWAVLRGLLWPALLALPLLAVGAWWAVHSGTAPLRRLSRQLAERQPQALQPVDLPDAPSEMQPMLGALNGLFDRIATLMTAERRFTADAAHELRTPLAAIRAQAQVALAETDDAQRRHALQATLAGCDRATRLVAQLLTLSRLESGDSPPLATLDLAPLVRQVVADLVPQALARQQTVTLDADSVCPVSADATLAQVLVRNLVDNAIRYSPPGATVAVSVSLLDGRASLRVDDSGPGLSESDQQRLGERFFRVLGTDQPGSGLGWSIVRRIADAHRATLRLGRSGALGGLSVVVDWPAAR